MEAAMSRYTQDNFSLHTPRGERKYVNQAERQRLLDFTQDLARQRALFSLLLAWTGASVSEALAVTANSFDLDRSVVALRTLKRRRPHVREIPISPGLVAAFDQQFGLRELQCDPEAANQRLWSFGRVTAWRFVKDGMLHAGVVGKRACPRGLRHGFAIAALARSVPLNFVQKWLGHSRITTTQIYTAACGPEELAFAARLWDH